MGGKISDRLAMVWRKVRKAAVLPRAAPGGGWRWGSEGARLGGRRVCVGCGFARKESEERGAGRGARVLGSSRSCGARLVSFAETGRGRWRDAGGR